MSGHDKAIEAAETAWCSCAAAGGAGTSEPMRRAIAAFLRYRNNSVSMRSDTGGRNISNWLDSEISELERKT